MPRVSFSFFFFFFSIDVHCEYILAYVFQPICIFAPHVSYFSTHACAQPILCNLRSLIVLLLKCCFPGCLSCLKAAFLIAYSWSLDVFMYAESWIFMDSSVEFCKLEWIIVHHTDNSDAPYIGLLGRCDRDTFELHSRRGWSRPFASGYRVYKHNLQNVAVLCNIHCHACQWEWFHLPSATFNYSSPVRERFWMVFWWSTLHLFSLNSCGVHFFPMAVCGPLI